MNANGGEEFLHEKWAARIAALPIVQSLGLAEDRIAALTAHACAVLAENAQLHLTTITECDAFVARHIEESLLGAAMLPRGLTGSLLDIGSGNGYPGLALSIAHPGLRPMLAEATAKKAAFLERALAAANLTGEAWPHHVQRMSDLPEATTFKVIVSRAMGGWQKIVPRLVAGLDQDGWVLLWTGEDAEDVILRKAWNRLERIGREAIPGRERSWIQSFRPRH